MKENFVNCVWYVVCMVCSKSNEYLFETNLKILCHEYIYNNLCINQILKEAKWYFLLTTTLWIWTITILTTWMFFHSSSLSEEVILVVLLPQPPEPFLIDGGGKEDPWVSEEESIALVLINAWFPPVLFNMLDCVLDAWCTSRVLEAFPATVIVFTLCPQEVELLRWCCCWGCG